MNNKFSVAKTERNNKILELWQSGKYKSMASLGRQFRITRSRVSAIIKTQKKNGNGHK